MRVLTVTNMYPSESRPYFGSFVHDRVESLRRAGVEMEVWACDGSANRGAYVRRLPELRRLLASGNFDLVHCEHTYSILQCVVALPRRSRPRLLLTSHEPELFASRYDRDAAADALKRLVFSRRLKLRAMNAADRVVAVQRDLPRLAGYRRSYDVIAPGIDLDRFAPIDRRVARGRLGLPKDRRLALFPADPRRVHHKGGELFEQVRHALGDSVDWMVGGRIPFEQMPLYVNAADVVLQTSRYEASPMVAKEALACNRPFVSTDVGDVRELFGRVDSCLIAEPNAGDVVDKIRRAFELEPAACRGRDAVVRNGLALDEVAGRYLELYRELVGSRAKVGERSGHEQLVGAPARH